MKDSNDKQTLDLLDKPRRGRPPTGKAKTQAQIQREYRQRKKERNERDAPFAPHIVQPAFCRCCGRQAYSLVGPGGRI